MFCGILTIIPLFGIIKAQHFFFDQEPTNVILKAEVPLNYSTVYGKIEPEDSEWFILFEVDHSLVPATYLGVNEEIQAGDQFPECPRFEAVREIKFVLELHPWFMRIRGGNVERYEHPDQVQFGHKFTVELFVQEDEDGPLCNIEVSTNVVGQSLNAVRPTPTKVTNLRIQSRRTLAHFTPTPSTKRYQNNLRFATFKMTKVQTTSVPSASEVKHTYIDIKNDRKVYEQVQKSRTREINAHWSPTFQMFLWLEVLVIGSFVVFGLVMFVVLQVKPSDNDKFIALSE